MSYLQCTAYTFRTASSSDLSAKNECTETKLSYKDIDKLSEHSSFQHRKKNVRKYRLMRQSTSLVCNIIVHITLHNMKITTSETSSKLHKSIANKLTVCSKNNSFLPTSLFMRVRAVVALYQQYFQTKLVHVTEKATDCKRNYLTEMCN